MAWCWFVFIRTAVGVVVNGRAASPSDEPPYFWEAGARTGVPRPPRRAGVRLRERDALFDARHHGLVDLAVLAKLALALGTLA